MEEFEPIQVGKDKWFLAGYEEPETKDFCSKNHPLETVIVRGGAFYEHLLIKNRDLLRRSAVYLHPVAFIEHDTIFKYEPRFKTECYTSQAVVQIYPQLDYALGLAGYNRPKLTDYI